MRDQMIKQLTPQDDIVELERGEETVTMFTRQQLINFTREIQERCKQTVLEAINNSGIDFSSSKGKWDMNNGILTMEIVDEIPPTNYTYQFSEDNRTLTLTPIDSNDSYILRKQ